MKFKEKDPIVSMEQWFPDKPLEYVKELVGNKSTETRYTVYECENPDLKETFIHINSSAIENKYEKNVKVYLVENIEGGRTHFVYKLGLVDTNYGTLYWVLAMLNPSDWVLTYQSGRREVLTDKEKQERFE